MLEIRGEQWNSALHKGSKSSLALLTCGHVLQHLQQHVLRLVDQLRPLHHQLPQAQVAVEHRAHQTALEVPLDRLHLHKGGKQPWGEHHTRVVSASPLI